MLLMKNKPRIIMDGEDITDYTLNEMIQKCLVRSCDSCDCNWCCEIVRDAYNELVQGLFLQVKYYKNLLEVSDE